MSAGGPWSALPGELGGAVAIAGDVVVAATLSRLTGWRSGVIIAEVTSPRPNPARPVVVGDTVSWGSCLTDLTTGRSEFGPFLADALPGYEQTMATRSPDGGLVLAAGRWGGPLGAESPAVVAALAGDQVTVLWRAHDLAPEALWCGQERLVVGCRGPRVLDHAGTALGSLPSVVPPFRIESAADERLLLIADHGRLLVAADGQPLGSADGAWLDAAITPDGSRVVALDFSDQLHFFDVRPGLPETAVIAAPDPISRVGLSDTKVVASFGVPPAVRVADLSELAAR